MEEKISIEKEFKYFELYHKYIVIFAGLIAFYDNDELRNNILLGMFTDLTDTKENNAEVMANTLLNHYFNGNTTLFNKVYEYCWEAMKEKLDDKYSVVGDMTIEEIKEQLKMCSESA